MITRVADIGLSEAAVEALEIAMSILWVVFLPLLIKFVVQLLFGTMATIQYAWKQRLHRRTKSHSLSSEEKDEVAIGASTHSIANTTATAETTPSKPPPPRVSVIVPAYNEEVGIVKTLQSVKNTKYPNLQLIVVNDGSTDRTHEKIKQWIEQNANDDEETQKEPFFQVDYLPLENGGKAAAMNTALKYVEGEFVVTVDADSVMHYKALDAMMESFDQPEVGAVAGNVIVANRSKPIGMAQQLEYLSGFFYKRADGWFGAVYIIGGASAAYRKSALDQAGSFDDAIITEDIELSTRILKNGFRTHYAHNAIVFTEGPSEWVGLANQRLRWKFGRLKTFWKHRDLFFSWSHNLYLSMFLLPLAMYAECLLFFDWIIFPLCIFYILFVNMEIFVMVLFLMTGITIFQILVDPKRKFHSNLLLVSPFTWLVACTIELIEFTALIRSLVRLALGQGLKWQKWKRVGLSDEDLEDEVRAVNTLVAEQDEVKSTDRADEVEPNNDPEETSTELKTDPSVCQSY